MSIEFISNKLLQLQKDLYLLYTHGHSNIDQQCYNEVTRTLEKAEIEVKRASKNLNYRMTSKVNT